MYILKHLKLVFYKKYFFIFCLILTNVYYSVSQEENLDSLINTELGDHIDYTIATFKATRVINGQSIERMQKGDLDFRITHRFGEINTGIYNFYGLDYSNINFSLEYGLNNWAMFGIGRGTYNKTYSGFLKFSILRQSKGKKNMPVSLSYFSGMYVNSQKWLYTERNNHYSSRIAYCHQILIARKFNKRLSVQLTPSLVHRNLVQYKEDANDIYSIGFSGRYKLINRVAVNFEYFYVLNPNKNSVIKHYNPLSVGFDIETGGHVFQIILSNSTGITENIFIPETTGKWGNGGICLGFNISRVFTIKKKSL